MGGVTTYRTYWTIWAILLVLTIVMLLVEDAAMPVGITIAVLAVAMLVKASFIGGWFMHLRYETRALAITLVAVTLITAAFMFFLLIPDAQAVYESVVVP